MHQVRVHLAGAGTPIVGDTRYGGPAEPGLVGHFLHAERLRLPHPATGAALDLRAPLPADRQALLVERDGALAICRGSLRGDVGITRGEQPAWAGLRRQRTIPRLLDDVAFELHRFLPVGRCPRLAGRAERVAELHAAEADICARLEQSKSDRSSRHKPYQATMHVCGGSTV